MNDDQLFRLMLLVGFAFLLPVGIYHRLKSHTGEKLDRRQEGRFILIGLRLLGMVGWLGVIAYLVHPPSMAWATAPLPVWMRWAGIGFLVVAGVLLFWTLRSLGRNLTDTVVTRKNHTLVTTGPYRWVRHPFYTSAALMVPGSSLAAANWFFFVIGCVVFLLLAIRTGKEEQNLIGRFGDDYRNYRKRTGRFIPRVSALTPHRIDGPPGRTTKR
jgi:protein-S-isoprenylcysteine O-methyltransferase Ste14